MDSTSQLIDLRKKWMGTQEMAQALGVERTLLWKRERWPNEAPSEFWGQYAEALRSKIKLQAQEVLQALETVNRVAVGVTPITPEA